MENSGWTEITGVCHGVDVRFAATLHKVEGKTVRRLCADLNDHSFQPHITFHGLFVAVSRVRTKKHFARLPYQPEQTNLQHLRNLKPPPNLLLWLRSYNEDGYFDPNLLRAAETNSENRKRPSIKTKRQLTSSIDSKQKRRKENGK